MRRLDGRTLLSASDLMRFTGCAHATALDLDRLHGRGPEPRADDDEAQLLQGLGEAHEAAHLERLTGDGRSVVKIERDELAKAAAETHAALADGPDTIYQGAFLSGNWGGWSDFLERVEEPSDLGAFGYEVADTKLKRTPHPKHALQLVLYSDLLAEIQGRAPKFAHVELGDGTRARLRLSDYAAYAQQARERLEDFVADPWKTRPVPCADCNFCRWSDHCAEVWDAEDSLFNVANITRGQVKKLEAAGVRTMQALASRKKPVPSLAEPTRERLTIQAELQHARKDGDPSWVLRDPEPGKGFDLLPEPQTGNLFYDIEGDPLVEGGLEYLHGIWFDGRFRAFWAHDHEAEAQALSGVLEFFRDHLSQFPAARIHHYASYEVVALRRLAMKHGRGEAFLDRLLRERRFVDLFAVVRGALIGSERDYSLKSMEALYGRTREGEVQTAAGSIVAYERWRNSGDRRILDEIEEYNRIDCISTQELRDWLVGIRPDRPWPAPTPPAENAEIKEDGKVRTFRVELAASELSAERQEMLFNLRQFHAREAKPAQWAVFDSVAKDEDDLIDDVDALAGLEALGPAERNGGSLARTYRFPPQETKLRKGKEATVPALDAAPATVRIAELDQTERTVAVKTGKGKAPLLRDRLTLHPAWPLDTAVIAGALRRVIADQCGSRRFTAIADTLDRAAPRLKDWPDSDILGDADPVEGTVAAVAAMDGTVLPIQGPPGSGKTYVAARAILSTVAAGHRVGVSSNSHEAIRNVLMSCLKALKEDCADLGPVEMAHKVSDADDGYPEGVTGITRVTDNDASALSSAHVVGGTAFFFSRFAQEFDWLFVDEAGQVSLANMLAMGRAARNVVLIGDPCQLPQVIQGAHPHPANLSCMEWLLGDHATIPPDKGIFLRKSRRMHPDVCKFVSDHVYEGRLTNHPDTATQRVGDTALPETGAFWMPVAHDGNAQSSPEEVSAISAAIDELLRGTWTGQDGKTQRMRKRDIIVVAPYNAQVNALRAALPKKIRVGTVDKFQGQEAPVCLVSMTTSSVEEMPRGMEFLFSLNRINVAVSRAQALALVFGSPRLREAKCETIERMRLVNTLCALPQADAPEPKRAVRRRKGTKGDESSPRRRRRGSSRPKDAAP